MRTNGRTWKGLHGKAGDFALFSGDAAAAKVSTARFSIQELRGMKTTPIGFRCSRFLGKSGTLQKCVSRCKPTPKVVNWT